MKTAVYAARRIFSTLGFVSLVSLSSAQPFGLTNYPDIAPFLNNFMPETAPVVGTNWSVVPAFPNLVFADLLGVTAVPGTPGTVVGSERESEREWVAEDYASGLTDSAGIVLET